jgi:hypothetical protein
MKPDLIFPILFGLSITMMATSSYSGEAEITLKHGAAQPNNSDVKASGSEPLVPHHRGWEDRKIEPSTTNNTNRPKYGPVLKVKPQGIHEDGAKHTIPLPGTQKFQGIEPDEIGKSHK